MNRGASRKQIPISSNDTPSFFLTTAGEYSGLAEPRACWTIGRLKDAVRDDYLLVEIEPPLSGQSFGLGAKDIAFLLLSTKLKGRSLFPITEWPCYVFVSRVLDEAVLKSLAFSAGQVEMIAWGFLYPTLEEATAVARRY